MRCVKIFILSIVMLIGFNMLCFAEGETADEYYQSFYRRSGAGELEESLPDYVEKYLDDAGLSLSDYGSMITASPRKLFETLVNVAVNGLGGELRDMVSVAAIAIIAGVIREMSVSDNLSSALDVVIGSAVAVGTFTAFSGVISSGISAVSMLADFMLALIPVLAGIITAAGDPTLALTYSTFVMAAAQGAGQIARSIILPLCGAFAAFGISASISPDLKLTKLSELIKKTAIGTLSLVATVFSALLGLKSLLAGSADSLASKGIKLALSSGVPIVGGALSDAYSSIVGSLSLLKNTVGVFAVAAAVLAVLPCVAQLTVRILFLKLIAIMSSALGDSSTGEALETLSSALTVINSVIVFLLALFTVSTGIVISIKGG